MRINWGHGTFFLAVGLMLGYAGSQFDQARASRPEPISSTVPLALVEDTEISGAEVRSTRPAEFLNLERQLHDLRSQALESAIQEELINREAEARGIEPSELVRIEVDEKVEDPSDEEVEAFYRARQIQGPLEQIAPQIRAFLRDQERGGLLATFLAELETRYSVERRLDPFRSAVESEGFPSKGPGNAPVTMVAFSDFQCPYCRLVLPTLQQIQDTFGDQVRLVFRQFPLTQIHPQAVDAARASLCADEQDRFWEMHDAMFENQRALQVDQLKATARDVGLDGAEFDACMDSDRYARQVMEDLEAGRALGITGTPMTFINGRALSGAKPYEEFAEIVEDELRRAGR